MMTGILDNSDKKTICGMPDTKCLRWLRSVLREDIGRGDITSQAVVGFDVEACGRFICKKRGVVAGLPLLQPLFALLDSRCEVDLKVVDGSPVKRGMVLAEVRGPARAILSGERVALNLLQRLGGVATLTRQYVERVHDTGVAIMDTRKTLPGVRLLEKYAVRCGGGKNHRLGLDDQVLIKDTHLASLGGGTRAIEEAVRRCHRLQRRGVLIEVEVATIVEAMAAARAGADIVMLDNMRPTTVHHAVQEIRALEQQIGRRVILEASGGITLRNAAAYAQSGVDWISVGALTHSAPALDISLNIVSMTHLRAVCNAEKSFCRTSDG